MKKSPKVIHKSTKQETFVTTESPDDFPYEGNFDAAQENPNTKISDEHLKHTISKQ